MADRIPLDEMTSDQLDALYDRAEGAEAARDRLFRSRDRQAARAARAKAEAARYRTAWKSAAFRAEARGEGIMRLCDDRDAYKGWMEQEQAYTAHLRTTLAKSEQGRRNLRGLLEHHRDQGSLGILRTTRTRLARALKACARYRAEVTRLTAGQCTHAPTTSLRTQCTASLTAAACDGDCGLTERACQVAHPITRCQAGGVTHIDGPVTAIVDTILAALYEHPSL